MIKKIKELLHIQTEEPAPISFDEKMFDLFSSLYVDDLNINLGSDLTKYGDILGEKIWLLREKIKELTGIIIPPVRVSENTNLQENEYQILVRGNVVFNDFVIPNNKFVQSEILYNLELICKEKLEDIISCETIEKYINLVQSKNKYLANEVINFFYIVELKKIFLGLVKNNCAINDIFFVFEQISKNLKIYKNTEKLITTISQTLPEFEWDIQKHEYPKYNIEKM